MNIGRWSEEDFYIWIRGIRDIITYPIIRILAAIGIRPDVLTYLGIISMLGFVYFVDSNPVYASGCLVASLLMDNLDGGLARYLKVQSDLGKFTDVLADTLNFTLFVLGLVYASLISGVVAVLYVYFTIIMRILLIIKKNLHKETDWLIRPLSGGLLHVYAIVSYALYIVFAFTGFDILEKAVLLFSFLLIIETAVQYWSIKTTVFAK